MTAYRYANIKKYLHGIAFKGGSHMPCGQGLLARFAIWPPFVKQRGGRPEPRIERFVDAMFFENVCRDERQLVKGLSEFRGHVSCPLDTKQIPCMAAEIYRMIGPIGFLS